MPAQRRRRLLASRRRFLAVTAAAGAFAAGCRPLFEEKTRPARPDPDVTATVAALDRVEALLAAYTAAGGTHHGRARALRAFGERHEAHAAALRARLPAGHAARRSATPTASPSGTSTKDLAGAEEDAADAFATAALDVSPTLAQVLASMSACSAAHVRLLAEVRS